MAVAGDTITIFLTLRDAAGAAITDAVDDDFTNTIRHTTPDGTVSTPSQSDWEHVANGLYRSNIAPAVEGSYAGAIDYAGPPIQTFIVSEPVTADVVGELQGGQITVSGGPVAVDGDVTLYESDDYSQTDSRALNWTTSAATTWPTLTGASIEFTARHNVTGSTIEATGTVVTATGAAKHVRVELAADKTTSKPPGEWTYQVCAVISGRRVTLVRDELDLIPRVA